VRTVLRNGGSVVLAGASLLLAPAVCAAEGPAAGSAGESGGATIASLSNFKTVSHWAYPQARAAAYARPTTRSRVVGRLRFLTADGEAALYLTLRSYTLGQSKWILVSLPGRPNGSTGWVPARALGELHATREYLRVDREALHATLYRRGRPIWRAPVGVGRPSLPTPRGRFYVTGKLTAIGGAFYGPYALPTSAYAPTLSEWPGGGIITIHGTDEPQLIPGRPSHGCIRLRNRDIAKLWRLVGVGTPIEIV
jgi:lipoprotein-anchoring transpeptidase ErfK/SrfK